MTKIDISSFTLSIIISIFLPYILKNIKINNSISSQKNNVQNIKNNTPILGGLIFSIPSFVYLLKNGKIDLFLYLLINTLFGFIDDLNKILYKGTSKGISSFTKIIFQIVSFYLYWYLIKGRNIITKLSYSESIEICTQFLFYNLITIGILITDGIDGLLGSLSISTILNLISFDKDYKFDDNEIFTNILVNLIPFLFLNINPAKIFMGDTGSYFIASSLYYLFERKSKKKESIVYILNGLTSIIQRLSIKLRNKKIFLKAPFHHQLEMLDFSENNIVLLYNFIQIIIIYGLKKI